MVFQHGYGSSKLRIPRLYSDGNSIMSPGEYYRVFLTNVNYEAAFKWLKIEVRLFYNVKASRYIDELILLWLSHYYGNRSGNTWPRGYTPCWQLYTDKTRVMPFISTKSVACMSTSWLLGNVYTAKSCKSKKRDNDALKLGLLSYWRQHWPFRIAGGCAWGWQPHPGKYTCHEIWRSNSRIL
jgi:hypothetical protein